MLLYPQAKRLYIPSLPVYLHTVTAPVPLLILCDLSCTVIVLENSWLFLFMYKVTVETPEHPWLSNVTAHRRNPCTSGFL